MDVRGGDALRFKSGILRVGAQYTSSGKGIVNDAGVKASAKKVSSITFGNCPGLTSSNWKSSKGKLVLKWQ